MKVVLLSYTKDAEVLCATAAKTCYSKGVPSEIKLKVTAEKAGKLIDDVVSMGHHSVIEHAYYTFSIEGVSRALAATAAPTTTICSTAQCHATLLTRMRLP